MPVARTPLSPVRPRLVWRPSSSSLPAPRPLPDPAPTDLARPCWRDLAGRFLLVAGALLVAFAAFQTWGTSLGEWRSQEALTAQLEQPSGSGAGSGRLAPTMATLGSEPYDPTSGSVATGPAAASTFAGNNVSPAPASTSWPTDQAMGRIEI